MPKDWKKRVGELEEQVRITKKKAELQELLDKKAAKKGKSTAAPKKKSTNPKAPKMKAIKGSSTKQKAIGAPPPQIMLMMPNGATIPLTMGKIAAPSAPKVIEPP